MNKPIRKKRSPAERGTVIKELRRAGIRVKKSRRIVDIPFYSSVSGKYKGILNIK